MPSLDPLTFLGSLPVFTDAKALQGPALADLADRAEVWTYTEGDVVRFPDEAPAGPTWVAEGCLVVLNDGGIPRYIGVREPVDVPAGPWIRGKTAGRLVTVPEGAWRQWLHRWPEAAMALGEVPPPAVPAAVYRSPLVLEPGETPQRVFRKSRLFLARRAALPLSFLVLFVAFGGLLESALGDRVPALTLWFVPGAGMLVTLALASLVVWEWSTSVLVVTDRAVLVRQIDVWTHRSDFEKLALERIREAVFRRTFVGNLLRLVDLEIEGDSPKGRLVFSGLARDSEFLGTMEGLRTRRKSAQPARRLIRRALADRMGKARAPLLEHPARLPVQGAPKNHRLSWRCQRGTVVWFRRHPWVLGWRSLPWVGWAALTVFLGAVTAAYWPAGAVTAALVAGAVCLVPLGRIAWEAWDWANDRLSIQGDKIVLVQKKPLWLGEVRQEGSLDQIEQVGVRKGTLTALVLDYGTVTINLGGAEPLVFDHASHPEWVQNEIFYRRTILAQERERQAVETRLAEFSEILDTWDEAKKAGYFNETKEQP